MSSKHFDDDPINSECDFLALPALWGLIPRWHKGNYKEHGFNTKNYGVENLNSSRMYKPAFNRGQRCVMPCEGYYEHQRVPYRLLEEERSIYYIHSKQAKKVEVYDKSTWINGSIKLLYIAGIFDVWTDDKGSDIYNFTILSMKSQENMLSGMHPRTPVLLESAENIRKWLDFDQFDGESALSILKHPKNIEWYEVSRYVLNPKNKDIQCIYPLVKLEEEEEN